MIPPNFWPPQGTKKSAPKTRKSQLAIVYHPEVKTPTAVIFVAL